MEKRRGIGGKSETLVSIFPLLYLSLIKLKFFNFKSIFEIKKLVFLILIFF